MVRILALDFDGVLLHSLDVKGEVFAGLFGEVSEELTERIIRYHKEHPALSRFDKIRTFREWQDLPASEEEVERLATLFGDRVRERLAEASLVAGVKEYLEQMAHRMIPVYIVSSAVPGEITAELERRNLHQLIAGVYGYPEVKAEVLKRLIHEGGVLPSELLFIGDALSDLEAAKQAGSSFIGRGDATSPLSQVEGLMVVSDFVELLKNNVQ